VRPGPRYLGGLPVVAHLYRDTAGHRIVLLQADQSFPPRSAPTTPAGSHTWVTEVDGVVLLAASRLGLDIRRHEGSPERAADTQRPSWVDHKHRPAPPRRPGAARRRLDTGGGTG
jgi:hypothetical protein